MEKGARLWLRVLALAAVCVIFLILEWWQDVWNELAIWTGLGFSIIIAGVSIASWYNLAWANESRILADRGGMRVPIRNDDPIDLEVTTDEEGKSRFKLEHLLIDNVMGNVVLGELKEFGYQAYRGGLSALFQTHRNVVYVTPKIIVEVKDYLGNTHRVNYGAWKWGPKTIMVNGKFHKYKRWKDLPNPFRKALLRIPDFDHKKDRVRICFFPEFDLKTMRQIAVPVDLADTLHAETTENLTLRSATASMGGITAKALKDLERRAEKGDLKAGRRTREGNQDEDEGAF